MAAIIYDSTVGAFKDAEMPLIYDAAAGAYKDSIGLVYDKQAGAWAERWGTVKPLYIVKDGKCKTDILTVATSNMASAGREHKSPTVTQSSGFINAVLGTNRSAYFWVGTLYFSEAVSISKYKKLCIDCSARAGGAYGHVIVYTLKNKPVTTAYLRASAGKTIVTAGISERTQSIGRTVIEMDVSEIEDDGFIAVMLGGPSVGYDTTYINIYNLWLE